MMQRWLDVREKQPDRLTENDIFGAAVANIGAGAETVSATAQAVVYNLIRRPELLKKVTEEIDTAQMRGELSQVVQFSEAIKLPFLQACVSFDILQGSNYR
jgi:cytochrome P450